jgi:hypothetical protein
MKECQDAFKSQELTLMSSLTNKKGRFFKEGEYFIRFVNALIVLTILFILLRMAEFIVQ